MDLAKRITLRTRGCYPVGSVSAIINLSPNKLSVSDFLKDNFNNISIILDYEYA